MDGETVHWNKKKRNWVCAKGQGDDSEKEKGTFIERYNKNRGNQEWKAMKKGRIKKESCGERETSR